MQDTGAASTTSGIPLTLQKKKTSPRSPLMGHMAADATVPYKKYSEGDDPNTKVLKTPSMLLQTIAQPPNYLDGIDDGIRPRCRYAEDCAPYLFSPCGCGAVIC